MTSPLPLPDWVPWWVHLVLLLGALLFGLLFLLMPFSVFGVKARLEGVEARLDEIQGEIRSLAMRLPEPVEVTDQYAMPGDRGVERGLERGMERGDERGYERGRAMDRPPIPPAAVQPVRGARPAGRSEPRLY